MSSDLHKPLSKLPWLNLALFPGLWIAGQQQGFRQVFTEALVHFADRLRVHRVPITQTTTVNPSLHLDMRNSLQLKVTLFRFRFKVTLERLLGADWMCVMPFDMVAVGAIGCAHNIRKKRGVMARGPMLSAQLTRDRAFFEQIAKAAIRRAAKY